MEVKRRLHSHSFPSPAMHFLQSFKNRHDSGLQYICLLRVSREDNTWAERVAMAEDFTRLFQMLYQTLLEQS